MMMWRVALKNERWYRHMQSTQLRGVSLGVYSLAVVFCQPECNVAECICTLSREVYEQIENMKGVACGRSSIVLHALYNSQATLKLFYLR